MSKQERAEYIRAARDKGADTGRYAATKGWVSADKTIWSAAIGYVNRLPLNDAKFEQELVWNYCAAAEIAATGPQMEAR
ncbi:MAG TPA: hypothetical protein VKQ11_00580 [Candidatus Sulfotelmatobacter sp.]|nr:hypothetical protein [Candidatus Sulfotelmatobacter sp.]